MQPAANSLPASELSWVLGDGGRSLTAGRGSWKRKKLVTFSELQIFSFYFLFSPEIIGKKLFSL